MKKIILMLLCVLAVTLCVNTSVRAEDDSVAHKIAAEAELKKELKAEEIKAEPVIDAITSPSTDKVSEEEVKKAEEAIDKKVDETKEKAASVVEAVTESEFTKDMQKIRDILVDGAGDRPLLRGMMLPMFQPVFIMVMFCFGLWASQLSDRVPNIWNIPAALFLSIVIAAFITAFHTEWKPDLTFKDNPYLPDLSNIEVASIFCAVAVGLMVSFNKSISPLADMLFAGAVGFITGLSQASVDADGNLETLIFWVGFGITAIVLNIIGIGFDTFLKSMKLNGVVRFFGFLTVVTGCILAVRVF